MPAVRVSTSFRKGLLLRYDSLIEVVDVDADHPEEEFGQGGLVAESSVCGRARLLWTHSALQEPENQMATRLAHQRVHGDALLVFHHDVPWLKTIDSSQQYPLRTLLQISMAHAPGGREKHASHPVRPCIRTVVACILGSQAFPPRVGHKKPPQPYLPHGATEDTVAEPGGHHPPRASFDLATATHTSPQLQPDTSSMVTVSQLQPSTSQPGPTTTVGSNLQPDASPMRTDGQPQPATSQPASPPTVGLSIHPDASSMRTAGQAQPSVSQPAQSPAVGSSAQLDASPMRTDGQAQPAALQPAVSLAAVPRRKRQTARGGPADSISTSTVYKQSSRLHEHPDGPVSGCPGCNPPPQIHKIHAYLEKKRLQKEQDEAAQQLLLQQQARASAPAPSNAAAESRKHGAAHAADNDDLASHKRAHLDMQPPDHSSAGAIAQPRPAAAESLTAPLDAQAAAASPPPALSPPAPLPDDPLGLRTSSAAEASLAPAGPGASAAAAPVMPPPDTAGAAEILLGDAAPVEAPWLPAAPRGGATAGAPPQGDWEALHPDVLHMVFLKLSCQDLVAASGVCVAWRSTAVRDRQALEVLQVKLAPQPLRIGGAALGAVIGIGVLARLNTLQLPRVVLAAADTVACPSACLVAASVCEVRADLVGAAGYWKKAAKGGIAIAMYKLGTHFYRGDIVSLGRSGEDAVMWLQRFLRAADPASSATQDPGGSVGAGAETDPTAGLSEFAAALAGGGGPPPQHEPPVPDSGGGSMLGAVGRTARARQRRANTVLDQQVARASLLLGFLHMDGEGTKTSNLEAVRHMRRAALLGDEEAHRTLGWMYNTGQFGESS